MFAARASKWFLRLDQTESSRLAWAFAISLAFHLVVFGGYYTGKKFNVWQNLHWPAWLQPVKMLVDAFKKKETAQLQPQPQPEDVPLMFLSVSPAQAVAEPPKDAKYYSDKNSRAANPETDKDVGIPKITGNQTEVAKTEDVPREKFTPLQPARPAPAKPAPEQQPEMKAKPTAPPGDLTMAKPDLNPRKDEGKDQHTRPRTIEEAKARQQRDNRIPGQKMKQEGGVKRHLEFSSQDAKGTPFGAYDAALVEAISQRWFTLLDERGYASDSHGKVVLYFVLHPDGRITDMMVAQNTSGEVESLICEKAIRDPAPFPRWPDDMRHIVGETRKIQFTFYYN